MSKTDWTGIAWPGSRLEEAVETMLHRAGLVNDAWAKHESVGDITAEAGERVEHQALRLGCEAIALQTTFAGLRDELPDACPMLLQIGPDEFLAIAKAEGSKLRVITPEAEWATIPIEALCQRLRAPVEQAKREEYQQLFVDAGLTGRKRDRAVAALLDEQFGRRPFQQAWTLRKAVHCAGVPQFLERAGVLRSVVWLVVAHVAEYLLWLAAWAVMGQLSFEGRMDKGWLTGWGLLLLTTVPFRVATTWLQGVLAIGMGASLKRRLLMGALKLDPESVRHLGVGSYLGQALESEAVETLALSGGVLGMLALVELVIAGAVLGSLSVLLAGWCVMLAIFGWRFLIRYEHWTGGRMVMTGDLIESMVGHRTRAAQMPPEGWHHREDAALTDYFERSRAIDSTGAWLVAAIPRGWLIAGMLWLAPSAMSGVSTGQALAVKLGGVLLAFTAFKKLTASAVEIVAAVVASKRIAPLFRAAAQPDEVPPVLCKSSSPAVGEKILEADRIMFRYRNSGPPALHPSSLTVRRGEKILLEGSSGGGKTTLSSLLSGMRKPASGLLLLHGLDSHTTGMQRWRQKIAAAPQFHENYILTETLAFNLLLGRQWPPTERDMQDAENVCQQLGLGNLLERMPGGIEQMVGEGGWQLSHGERSRIYVGRALLQRADLVILDESFGALDPENLKVALECTLTAAETLLVIAHP